MVSLNDHSREVASSHLLANSNCALLYSCRLQGFPESFQIPCSADNHSNTTKQHRQRVSQFYRQVGNAVSPPCVAAVATKSVERLFLTSTTSTSSVDNNCPVHGLLLRSCLYPDKVAASIRRKKSYQAGSSGS